MKVNSVHFTRYDKKLLCSVVVTLDQIKRNEIGFCERIVHRKFLQSKWPCDF
jgi:hypothetical protein